MAGVCNAEPDSTIKYLIDEPVSMLDYGIARMERMIPPPVNGNVSVSYSWEENRIIISVYFIPHRQDPYNPPYKDKEEAKNKIKEYLKKLKIFLKTTSFNEVYFNHKLNIFTNPDPGSVEWFFALIDQQDVKVNQGKGLSKAMPHDSGADYEYGIHLRHAVILPTMGAKVN